MVRPEPLRESLGTAKVSSQVSSNTRGVLFSVNGWICDRFLCMRKLESEAEKRDVWEPLKPCGAGSDSGKAKERKGTKGNSKEKTKGKGQEATRCIVDTASS